MQITYDNLKEMTEGSDLSLTFEDRRKDYGNIYCYVKHNKKILCALRSKANQDTPTTPEGTSYNLVFYGKNDSYQDKKDFRYAIATNITDENKRRELFQAFELDELSEQELVQMGIRQMQNELMSKMLRKAPNYGEFHRNPVFMVNMREQLVWNATETPKFVGTMGLGPCIGVGIISKKDGKLDKIGVAHIDALTDRSIMDNVSFDSISSFMNSFIDADEIHIALISSGNEKERALEILSMLYPKQTSANIHVCSEIDAPQSFCINTKTGTIYKDIPTDCFIFAQEKNLDEKRKYIIPGGLETSPFSGPIKKERSSSPSIIQIRRANSRNK